MPQPVCPTSVTSNITIELISIAMANPGFVALTVCLLLAGSHVTVRGLPRLNTRQLKSGNFQLRAGHDDVCKNYMESCVPWETTCCNNMECINLARGYCLYPLEKCLCQKVSVDFY